MKVRKELILPPLRSIKLDVIADEMGATVFSLFSETAREVLDKRSDVAQEELYNVMEMVAKRYEFLLRDRFKRIVGKSKRVIVKVLVGNRSCEFIMKPDYDGLDRVSVLDLILECEPKG